MPKIRLLPILLFLIALAVLAAVAMGILFVSAERMIFHPTRLAAEQVLQAAARENLTVWTPRDIYRGLVANPRSDRGSVLVFHGNAGHAGDRLWYAQVFAPTGMRIILAEYPGYGARDGKLELQALVEDARRTIIEAKRIDPDSPLIVVGESVGAGIAAQAISKTASQVDALMLITPWRSLLETAQHHYGWLPIQRMIEHPMDSAQALAGFKKPTVVVVAQHDEVIPAEQGLALASALGVPADLINNARHNDWRLHTDPRFWSRVFQRLVPEKP